MRVRIIVTFAAVALAAGLGGALAAPARAAVATSFDQRVRAADQHARQRLAATESRTRARQFAYYTVEDMWHYTGPTGWAAGFVPGGLWSGYQLSGSTWWRDRAAKRQSSIGAAKVSPLSVNLGALFYPSFARGYRLTGDKKMRATALLAAAHMAQRYDPVVGAMLSRPDDDFNVITDSLMKSQFLWWAVKNGGRPEYAEIARRHALTIARDFIRPDGSTWHMVFYDSETGAILRRAGGSAYSVDSTWARSQAWAVLGFAAAYRETGDEEFLIAARAVSDWYLDHLPADMVPYWDFGAPDIPLAPRDSSSAAIAASGLLDLALVDPDASCRARYEEAARQTLTTLMSGAYTSYETNPAVLLHGTYSWHMGIVDRGLAYGDAFFLEALLRLRRFAPDAAPVAVVRARASTGTAAAAVDGNLATDWVSRGRRSLDVRLDATREVGAVRVALYRGDDRAAVLRILVSTDGRRWRLARQTMTSGETAGYETLSFSPKEARWVRVECSGTTRGRVNRIAEVGVYPAL